MKIHQDIMHYNWNPPIILLNKKVEILVWKVFSQRMSQDHDIYTFILNNTECSWVTFPNIEPYFVL